jgi:hypothetical protein
MALAPAVLLGTLANFVTALCHVFNIIKAAGGRPATIVPLLLLLLLLLLWWWRWCQE